MKKISLPLIIVAILVAFGVFDILRSGTIWLYIIPIALVAIVLVLLKFPPNKWSKNRKSKRASMSDEQRYKEAVQKQKNQMKQKSSQSSYQSKTLPFKVIEGGRDDNDTPRYH